MCGIMGLYGADLNYNSNTKREFVDKGLLLSQWRGADSTGVALLSKKGNPQVYKRAIRAHDFIELNTYRSMLGNVWDSYGVIGHTRSKTQGQVVDSNAHPFQYGHITLVHNGSIQNGINLVDHKDRLKDPPTVDSAFIAHAMSVMEPDQVLPKIQGAYSLVWWDERDSSLHFARNDQRPMWWAFAKDKKMLYYASQRNFLNLLTNECNIEALDNAVYSTKVHTHYVFKTPNNVTEYESLPFVDPSQAKGRRFGKAKKSKHQAAASNTNQSGWSGATTSPSAPPTTCNKPTTTNSETTLTRGSVQHQEFVNTCKKHPCATEPMPQSVVQTIRAAEKQAKKLERTVELCVEVGVKFDTTLVVVPVMWRQYTGNADRGVMLCLHPTTKAKVQVFDVFKEEWEELSKLTRVPVKIKSHRTAYDQDGADNGLDPVFVAYIDTQTMERINKVKDSRRDLQERDGPTYDEGHKADYIEAGPPPRRWVSPEAFHLMVADGCINCSQTCSIADAEKIYWLDDGNNGHLCPVCANDNSVIIDWERAANVNLH
jgi:hypothetical protein